MTSYTTFLKIFGLSDILVEDNTDHIHEFTEEKKDNTDTDTDIVVMVHNVKDPSEDNCNNVYVRFFVNYFYKLFIATMITLPCVFAIRSAVVNKDIRYATSNVFTFLYSIQYMFSMYYYGFNHFDEIVKKYKANLDQINYSFMLTTFVSLVLAISSTVLLYYEYDLSVYADMWDVASTTEKVFLEILIFFDKFYSYSVLFTNMIIFFSVFLYHSARISEYVTKLSNFIKTNNDEIKISDISKQYIKIKTDYGVSVVYLNTMLSLVTIMGMAGLYFTVLDWETDFIGLLIYFDIVCYLITEIMYISAIGKVKNSVGDLMKLVNSEHFIVKYMSRENLTKVDISESENDITQSHSDLLRGIIILNGNARGIDLINLKAQLQSGWKSIEIFGFEITDETIIKKIVAIITAFLMLTNIGSSYNIF